MRAPIKVAVVLVVLALGAAACGGSAASATGGLVASDLQREAPSAPADDVAAVAAGGRVFAAAAYAQLASSGDGNVVFSPTSIRLALAMAYAGARGETATQMAGVLDFTLEGSRLHAALNALDQALASRNRDEGADPNTGQPRRVQISVANAIWGQEGFTFLSDFLDTLAQNYGAGMRVVDFRHAAEQARQTINQWIADQTNNRITELIPQGVLDELTRLVITNAIYLNANWSMAFDPDATGDAAFTLLDGSQVTASMMHEEEGLLYAAGNGWQAVELPYVGDEVAMLFVVPDAGRFSEVEGEVGGGLFDQIRAALSPRQVQLGLPKFEFHFKAGIAGMLASMGMPLAFDPDQADFSGMSTEEELYISDVIHEAFIKVDEAGTEAAAATAVVIGTTAMPIDVVNLRIDRPFLFTLYDRATGEILFMGRVVNPAA
jgi:serpin B